MDSASPGIVQTPQLATAKAILRIMGGASRFFPADLIHEPPLHILLHAFVAREERRHVSISQLAQLCTATPSTTLRWVGRLTAEGYVRRAVDPHDRRRSWIEISDDGCDRMICWLYAIAPAAPHPLH